MPVLPPFLQKGDKIAVIAPARKITLTEISDFIEFADTNGFEVVFTENLFASQNQFAGNDNIRAADFQYWLDSSNVKAIIAARG